MDVCLRPLFVLSSFDVGLKRGCSNSMLAQADGLPLGAQTMTQSLQTVWSHVPDMAVVYDKPQICLNMRPMYYYPKIEAISGRSISRGPSWSCFWLFLTWGLGARHELLSATGKYLDAQLPYSDHLGLPTTPTQHASLL